MSSRNSSPSSATRRYAIPSSKINHSEISQRCQSGSRSNDMSARIMMTAFTTMAAHRKVLFLIAAITKLTGVASLGKLGREMFAGSIKASGTAAQCFDHRSRKCK